METKLLAMLVLTLAVKDIVTEGDVGSLIENELPISFGSASDITITMAMKDGSEKVLEAFKAIKNDEILSVDQAVRTSLLQWFSVGLPVLKKTFTKGHEKLLERTDDGFNMYVQTLTTQNKEQIVDAVKSKYSLDVSPFSILPLPLSSFECELTVRNTSNKAKVQLRGSVYDFKTNPLAVEFRIRDDEEAEGVVDQIINDETSLAGKSLRCKITAKGFTNTMQKIYTGDNLTADDLLIAVPYKREITLLIDAALSSGMLSEYLENKWVCTTNDVLLRDLTVDTMINAGIMTLENCAKSCKTLGYSHAGAFDGNKCYCGSLTVDYAYAAGKNCDVPCEGNASQKCGGRYSVLVTAVERTTVRTFGYEVLGCFNDKKTPGWPMRRADPNRDLPSYTMWDHRNMTLSSCARSCFSLGHRYAAAQFAMFCSCGDSYGRHGKSAKCQRPCSGNSKEMCGGEWSNTVMLISEKTSRG